MSDVVTWGDRFPRLKELPTHAELAATPWPGAEHAVIPAQRPIVPIPSFDRDAHERKNLLILGCDYRGGTVLECGCTGTRVCLKGNGRPVPGADFKDVTWADCVACVTRT